MLTKASTGNRFEPAPLNGQRNKMAPLIYLIYGIITIVFHRRDFLVGPPFNWETDELCEMKKCSGGHAPFD